MAGGWARRHPDWVACATVGGVGVILVGELPASSWAVTAAVTRAPSSLPTEKNPALSRRRCKWGLGLSQGYSNLESVREEHICSGEGAMRVGHGGGPPRTFGLLSAPCLCPGTELWAGLALPSPGHCSVGRKAGGGESWVSGGSVCGGGRGTAGSWSRRATPPAQPAPALPRALPQAPLLPSGPLSWAQPSGW